MANSTKTKTDRRVERTRRLLLSAFNGLIIERPYEDISVRDIVTRADVGRSTFYEQFTNKDDVLRTSLEPVLAVFTDANLRGDLERIETVAAHFWNQRRHARVILSGTARRLTSALLAELIENSLIIACDSRRAKPLVPLPLIAVQLAQGQLALIECWLTGIAKSTPADIARALTLGSRASAAALFGSTGAGF